MTDVDERLTEALREIASEDRCLEPSPAVEHRLLDLFRAERAARRATRRRRAWALAASAIAAIALTAWFADRMQPRSATIIARDPVVPAPTGVEIATDYLPLPYSDVPLESGVIVRLEVPRSALVSFGLAPADAEVSGTVQADVLVGEDGLARAVRFIRSHP
jgi:hypothetical protein